MQASAMFSSSSYAPPPVAASDREWGEHLVDVADELATDVAELPPQPQMVASGVYLGGLREAQDIQGLEKRGVNCVLCLAPRECGESEDRGFPQSFTTLDIDSEDWEGYDMFEEDVCRALQFIEQCLGSGRPVLVHCFAGRNRSATVCAAWLMQNEGMPLNKVVQHLAKCRGLVLQNPFFNTGLVAVARARGLLLGNREGSR